MVDCFDAFGHGFAEVAGDEVFGVVSDYFQDFFHLHDFTLILGRDAMHAEYLNVACLMIYGKGLEKMYLLKIYLVEKYSAYGVAPLRFPFKRCGTGALHFTITKTQKPSSNLASFNGR